MSVEPDASLPAVSRIDGPRGQCHERCPVSSVERNLTNLRSLDYPRNFRIRAIQHVASGSNIHDAGRHSDLQVSVKGFHLTVVQVYPIEGKCLKPRLLDSDLVVADGQ